MLEAKSSEAYPWDRNAKKYVKSKNNFQKLGHLILSFKSQCLQKANLVGTEQSLSSHIYFVSMAAAFFVVRQRCELGPKPKKPTKKTDFREPYTAPEILVLHKDRIVGQDASPR
ncbi:hypothetical protein J6590_089171 [Homalodisca vitripennis]|nr:hypothetical protein J6590_089171 [Homalodisca vitripennis]